jgi:NADH-quinone oxidoreductase subunit E
MATQEVNRILRRYKNDPTDIIAILQDVQQTYRYLPKDVLEQISQKIDIPLSRIYHLSTFFRAFSLEERGKHEIHVCLGTACHVRGAPRILESFERGLKIAAGQTTKDKECTLETVNCVGACALGPVIIADEKSEGKMTPQKAERLLRQMNLGAGAAKKTAKKAPAAKKAVKKSAAAAKKGRAPAARKKAVAKKVKKTTKKAR